MGPAPNNCHQVIDTSLLCDPRNATAFHAGEIVFLEAPAGLSVLDHARQLLAAGGFSSVEDACRELGLPEGRWLCRELAADEAPASPMDPLRAALILGRCAAALYDDQRPVLWTQSRLARRVALHQPGDFYAD